MDEKFVEPIDPRMRELQAENERLHRMLAELLLQNQVLRDSKSQWMAQPKGE